METNIIFMSNGLQVNNRIAYFPRKLYLCVCMCTCLLKCRYVFRFILLFLFWFLPHLSSQPHASWEMMILFGELSKSFKTVFKSCNSTFVLLQLRTCQASSVYLDFSSAKWSKISIFCMKLPVFCMGINTSSAPSALRRLQLLFP